VTGKELAGAIARVNALCDAEVAAAAEEYHEARRKIAAVRKQRGSAARAGRDRQVADLKAQCAREQTAAAQ
jgi:hypothetical protein